MLNLNTFSCQVRWDWLIIHYTLLRGQIHVALPPSSTSPVKTVEFTMGFLNGDLCLVGHTVPWHNHHCNGDLQLADSNLSFNQKWANFWKETVQISTLTTEAVAIDEALLTVLELSQCFFSPICREITAHGLQHLYMGTHVQRVGGGKATSTPKFCLWGFFSLFHMTPSADRSNSLFSVCKTKLTKLSPDLKT